MIFGRNISQIYFFPLMQKNLSSPRNKVDMLFEQKYKDWQYNVKMLARWGRYVRWEGGRRRGDHGEECFSQCLT